MGWRTLLAWRGLAPCWLVWWLAPSLVRRMGLAPCWLVWWLASSLVRWMGLASRWLVWWFRLAARRRALWLWIRRWKLLLELPRRWLWACLLLRQRLQLLRLVASNLEAPGIAARLNISEHAVYRVLAEQ